MASEGEDDTLSELPALPPRRLRVVTQADAAEFAEAADARASSSASPSAASSSSSQSAAASPVAAAAGAVGPGDFELLCVIGQGAFGKVRACVCACVRVCGCKSAICRWGADAGWQVIQVRHTPSQEVLAMKVVANKYIVKHNSVAYLQTERDIMTKVKHPFLIHLRCAFQTRSNVYLVMPFVAGGELFHHLHKEGLLLEVRAVRLLSPLGAA